MRIWKKIALAAAAMALMTSPAWARPGGEDSSRGDDHAPATTPTSPTTTPNEGGDDNPSSHEQDDSPSSPRQDGSGSEDESGDDNGRGHGGRGGHRERHHRARHRCLPHAAAYVAAGTLVSQTLAKDEASTALVHLRRNDDGTYSGELTAEIKRTNDHAAPDAGTTKTYKVEHVRVRFDLADVDANGTIGLDDVQAGDRVKLIGEVTVLAPRCDHSGFTPQTTIRRIVLHPPIGA